MPVKRNLGTVEDEGYSTTQNVDEAQLLGLSSTSVLDTSDVISDDFPRIPIKSKKPLDTSTSGALETRNVIGGILSKILTKDKLFNSSSTVTDSTLQSSDVTSDISSDVEEKYFTAESIDKAYIDFLRNYMNLQNVIGEKSEVENNVILQDNNTAKMTDADNVSENSSSDIDEKYYTAVSLDKVYCNFIKKCAHVSNNAEEEPNALIQKHLTAVEGNNLTKKCINALKSIEVRSDEIEKNYYPTIDMADSISPVCAYVTSSNGSKANMIINEDFNPTESNAAIDYRHLKKYTDAYFDKVNSNTIIKEHDMVIESDNIPTTSATVLTVNRVKPNVLLDEFFKAAECNQIENSSHNVCADPMSYDNVNGIDISSVYEPKSDVIIKEYFNAIGRNHIQGHSEVKSNKKTKESLNVAECDGQASDSQLRNRKDTRDDKLIGTDPMEDSTDDQIKKKNANVKRIITYIWALTTLILFVVGYIFFIKYTDSKVTQEQIIVTSNHTSEEKPTYMYCRSIAFNETENIVWTLVDANDPIKRTKICHTRLVNAYVHELTNYLVQRVLIVTDWCLNLAQRMSIVFNFYLNLFSRRKEVEVSETVTVKEHQILDYPKGYVSRVITYLTESFYSMTDWFVTHCFNVRGNSNILK
ncbi:uncharacterized protein LOC119669331 [Teleopsis dalmanni]|uniref:uncharacterized protein LOC119669331 n=1 Tax=Teleopsis dalmanni TaxID=139649 RepID=UPI0018CE82C2|nr:uncharacterized protein LOC119669331 [Teleopsis dalmanni]